MSKDLESLAEKKSDMTVEQQLIDMLDSEGEIIFSNIELLWEERLGIFLSEESNPNDIKFSENWTFYPDTDINVINNTLDALFDKEI